MSDVVPENRGPERIRREQCICWHMRTAHDEAGLCTEDCDCEGFRRRTIPLWAWARFTRDGLIAAPQVVDAVEHRNRCATPGWER